MTTRERNILARTADAAPTMLECPTCGAVSWTRMSACQHDAKKKVLNVVRIMNKALRELTQ